MGGFAGQGRHPATTSRRRKDVQRLLILSIEKCLGTLILPFLTIADTLQSGVPKAKLPQTETNTCPKRILTPSIFEKQFCPLRWTRRSVEHFDYELSGWASDKENEEQMGSPICQQKCWQASPRPSPSHWRWDSMVTWPVFSQTHQNLSIQMIAVLKRNTLKGIITVLFPQIA